MENPKRARSWKRRLRPRVNLKNDVPVLYSTVSRSIAILEREMDWQTFLETPRRMLLASGVERQTVDFASFGTIRDID
jgi:hypothetical protein